MYMIDFAGAVVSGGALLLCDWRGVHRLGARSQRFGFGALLEEYGQRHTIRAAQTNHAGRPVSRSFLAILFLSLYRCLSPCISLPPSFDLPCPRSPACLSLSRACALSSSLLRVPWLPLSLHVSLLPPTHPHTCADTSKQTDAETSACILTQPCPPWVCRYTYFGHGCVIAHHALVSATWLWVSSSLGVMV